MIRLRRITALDAVTATTTSSKFWVGGARRVGIQFRRANHSAGTTTLSAKASLEPYDMGSGAADQFGNKTGGAAITVTALNMLIDNVANDNTEFTPTHVASKQLAANGDAFLWIDPACLINWLEITLTEGTDGTHSAWIVLEEELPTNGTY